MLYEVITDVALRPADQRNVAGVGNIIHRAADCWCGPGTLDDRLGHAPLRDRQDFSDGVAANRVDRVRHSQAPRQRQSLVNRIDDDRNRTDDQCILRREQADLAGTRITSYNVCYTKLLRL